MTVVQTSLYTTAMLQFTVDHPSRTTPLESVQAEPHQTLLVLTSTTVTKSQSRARTTRSPSVTTLWSWMAVMLLTSIQPSLEPTLHQASVFRHSPRMTISHLTAHPLEDTHTVYRSNPLTSCSSAMLTSLEALLVSTLTMQRSPLSVLQLTVVQPVQVCTWLTVSTRGFTHLTQLVMLVSMLRTPSSDGTAVPQLQQQHSMLSSRSVPLRT